MENTELVVPPPRRMAKYTVVKYRDIPTPGGTFTAKIEVGITCPHDAVLETTVTRLDMSTILARPVNPISMPAKPGHTCNVET